MDLLSVLKEFSDCSQFQETSNYYFQKHNCTECNNEVKVMLDYTLSCDSDSSILRFGVCHHCGKCFYHKDYESKVF